MARRGLVLLSLLALFAIFAGVNVFSWAVGRDVRADLTAARLHTLSPATRDVLARVSEPITLQLTYTRGVAQNYPAVRAHAAEVRALLRAYAEAAGGLIVLEDVNPAPFSAAEDAAIAAGLEAVPTDAGGPLFLGVVATNSVDETKVLRFLNPEHAAFLEFDLTRVVSELERPPTANVAVLSALEPMRDAIVTGGEQGAFAAGQLARASNATALAADFTALPEALDALVLAHPPALNDIQRRAIDAYAAQGGRLIVIVDPISRVAEGAFGVDVASDLAPLLEAWGVRFDPSEVVIDTELGLTAEIIEDGRPTEQRYPLWVGLTPANLSDDSLITSALSAGVNVATAGRVSFVGSDDQTFTPLLTSSESGAVIDADVAAGDPAPRDLFGARRLDSGPQVIAAQLSGPLSPAYPDNAPTDGPAHADIIVIADSDFLDDAFHVSVDPVLGPTIAADNAAFIGNALDLMLGAPELVRLRSRSGGRAPMTRVERLRADAETRFRETEAALQNELDAATARLASLEVTGRGSGFFGGDVAATLTNEEAREINALREEVTRVRGDLREVQRSFRADIDALHGWLVVANVWAAPILVALLGLFVHGARVRRRRAAQTQGAGA